MQDIIRLHVPSQMVYTSLVEDFMRSLGHYIYPEDKNKRDSLGTVMNEVFTNIVKHSHTTKFDGMVRFQLKIGSKNLVVSIFDHGPGIKINNELPPYTDATIGKKIQFRQVIDGAVYMSVLSPTDVNFTFEKSDPDSSLSTNIKYLKGHGLGLSIMTKIMDTVTYTMREDGQFDWLMIIKLD
jgi:anti-sigma regulatory factor (Ser/Thr protein kinase)